MAHCSYMLSTYMVICDHTYLYRIQFILLQLDIAKKYGTGITFNPNKCNVVEEVMSLTCGYGYDVMCTLKQ